MQILETQPYLPCEISDLLDFQLTLLEQLLHRPHRTVLRKDVQIAAIVKPAHKLHHVGMVKLHVYCYFVLQSSVGCALLAITLHHLHCLCSMSSIPTVDPYAVV